MLTVEEMGQSVQSFGVLDYTVFVAMLALCGSIGIYFGFVKKSATVDEYLVGGRNMRVLPVGMSLIASFISGISLLSIPTEIYVYGTSYLFIGFAIVAVGWTLNSVYLPVFHELRLTSTYEYLERRFDKKIRILGSVLFFIGNVSIFFFFLAFKWMMVMLVLDFFSTDRLVAHCDLCASSSF